LIHQGRACLQHFPAWGQHTLSGRLQRGYHHGGCRHLHKSKCWYILDYLWSLMLFYMYVILITWLYLTYVRLSAGSRVLVNISVKLNCKFLLFLFYWLTNKYLCNTKKYWQIKLKVVFMFYWFLTLIIYWLVLSLIKDIHCILYCSFFII